jgi:hypothetical protein
MMAVSRTTLLVGIEIGIGVTVGEGTVAASGKGVEKDVAVPAAEGVNVPMTGGREQPARKVTRRSNFGILLNLVGIHTFIRKLESSH